MPIFRYSRKDTYLVLYTVAMLALPYYMAVYTEPSMWWLAIGLVQSYLLANLQNTSLHHQTHWPAFNNNQVNSYYEILISTAAGVSHQIWKISHLLHHKYVNDPLDSEGKTKDPASVFARGKNNEPANFWVFITKHGIGAFLQLFYIDKIKITGPNTQLFEKYQKQCLREQLAIKLFFISILLINFYYGLFLLFVYLLSHIENFAVSYGEHYGVLDRRGDTTQDSVGCYNWFVNLIGFGAGYHQEHHHRPGVHWTRYHEVTHLLNPNRRIINLPHVLNNPFWLHLKQLIKKT
jgi:fatty acid desaturase